MLATTVPASNFWFSLTSFKPSVSAKVPAGNLHSSPAALGLTNRYSVRVKLLSRLFWSFFSSASVFRLSPAYLGSPEPVKSSERPSSAISCSTILAGCPVSSPTKTSSFHASGPCALYTPISLAAAPPRASRCVLQCFIAGVLFL